MDDQKKVLITRKIPDIAEHSMNENFTIVKSSHNYPMPNISLQKAMLEYDAILSTVCDKFDHDLLSFDDRKVEVISNYAAGLDNIDLESAKKNKVFVYNVPDVVTDSTADLTIALMLSSVRNINGAQNFIKNNEWHAWDPEIFVGTELRGKTLGIVGFGRIGQAVATRALAFGLKILYYNRSKKDFQDAEYCENLDTLLNTSDIISIHLPSTEKTKGFIGVEQFKKMNKALCFINTSRGDIVSNKALITALENKYICAAALDVVEGEPIDSTHKLLEYENCIIIPHIGTATYACRENMAKAAAMNIVLHYNIRGRIETVFKNVMKQNFCIDSDMYNTSLWDSLRHLMFLSSLEQEFNINFEHQEVSKMVDGYEVIKVVAKHVF